MGWVGTWPVKAVAIRRLLGRISVPLEGFLVAVEGFLEVLNRAEIAVSKDSARRIRRVRSGLEREMRMQGECSSAEVFGRGMVAVLRWHRRQQRTWTVD